MADPAVEHEKAGLRRKAHAARAALSDDFRADAARAIAGHFFDTVGFAPEDIIAGYWRIRDEADCQPILVRLLDGGQKVVLPVVVDAEQPL